MLRRISLILLALVLSACTLAPDGTPTPAPVTECPVCQPCVECTPVYIEITSPPIYIEITSTPAPTLEPSATETPVPVTPTPTPPPTLVPEAFLFEPQAGTPKLIENFTHPELACKWMGVGGQAFLLDGSPALNLVVVVSGTLNGQPVDMVTLTGLSQAYGEGGFELTLADKPVASQSSLTIQLFDLEGIPLSDTAPLETSAECGQNLILINFSPISG